MRRLLPSFSIFACVLAFCSVALPLLAQEVGGGMNLAKMFRSKAFQESQRRTTKAMIMKMWNGGNSALDHGLMHDEEVRKAWNVTEEQFEQYQQTMFNPVDDPEFAAVRQEMGELMASGKLFSDNSDPEAEQRFFELQAKLQEHMSAGMDSAIENVLTDEQKRKSQELQLIMMSESPIVSPTAFEALDLSEEQREKMRGIQKDLEPEFEKNMEELIDGQFDLMSQTFDILDKEGKLDSGNWDEEMDDVQKRVRENPEMKKRLDELAKKGQLFATQFQVKMFDVLTDEQWDRLQKIVDNPPEYAKNMLKRMKEEMGQDDEKDAAPNIFDAWKPGDPIPEKYREEREKRRPFPMKEKE